MFLCGQYSGLLYLTYAMWVTTLGTELVTNMLPICIFCGILIFLLGVLNFYFRKIFATAPKVGEKYSIFAIFPWESVLCSCFWHTESICFYFGFFTFAFGLLDLGYLGPWDCNPFLRMHTNVDQLDSGIAVQSTEAPTSKCQMIQADQFFNEPVANSSILVLMVHGMLKHQCNLQYGPTAFSQNQFVDNSVQGTSNAETMAQKAVQEHTTASNTTLYRAAKEKYHEQRKPHLCNLQFGSRHGNALLLELNIPLAIPVVFDHHAPNRSPVATSVQNTPPPMKESAGLGKECTMQHKYVQVRRGVRTKSTLCNFFFAEPIFAKGMQLKINFFFLRFLFGKTTPCGANQLLSQIIKLILARYHVT